jgi:hypothetical protein
MTVRLLAIRASGEQPESPFFLSAIYWWQSSWPEESHAAGMLRRRVEQDALLPYEVVYRLRGAETLGSVALRADRAAAGPVRVTRKQRMGKNYS